MERDIKTPAPDFDKITAADLRDDERLGALYVEACRRDFWPVGDQRALDFFALADKALKDDNQGTPGKLFYSLIKAKRTDRITDGQEANAMLRLPSSERQDLVRVARVQRDLAREERLRRTKDLFRTDEFDDFFGRDIGFSHAILMQCFLPQKALPETERLWVSHHGRASLRVEAGGIALTDQRGWRACGVPAGSMPRIVLPYIVREAISQDTRTVDLGHSLRNFMAQRLGVPVAGSTGKALVRAIEDVATASFYLGTWQTSTVGTSMTRVASHVSMWQERDPRQDLLWNPQMTLSADFFEAIQEHRVPVNLTHLRQLARSPRRMDLYCWLSYRTPRIEDRKPLPIKLDQLQAIFARDIKSPRHFKHRLRKDLAAIHEVYSRFRVEIEGDILWLKQSPPPIPMRRGALL